MGAGFSFMHSKGRDNPQNALPSRSVLPRVLWHAHAAHRWRRELGFPLLRLLLCSYCLPVSSAFYILNT